MDNKFEKITRVILPFDMRHKNPSKNYGIHGLDIWFILKGSLGAVQYAVTFPVYLPSIDTSSFGYTPEISGFDVGYHSPNPMYEGQPKLDCELLEEGKCYYDGSSLRAEDWTKEIFETIGKPPEEVIWKKLEEEYNSIFTKTA